MVRVTGKSLHILIVEDDADTAEVLGRLLMKLGYFVKTAGTVKDAVDDGLTGHYDVVLCDIGLPDGDGKDVYQQISASYPVKGIVMSGYGMEEEMNRSLESGFSEYLVKPIDFETLHRTIKRTVCNG
jgi:DNA-binding response OmpR family regulator